MSPEPTGVHGLLKQRKLFTHKYKYTLTSCQLQGSCLKSCGLRRHRRDFLIPALHAVLRSGCCSGYRGSSPPEVINSSQYSFAPY